MGSPIQITADFSSETKETIRKYHNIFQELKELSTVNSISGKLSFRNELEIKLFSEVIKLKKLLLAD